MPKNSPEMAHSKLLMLPENLRDALETSWTDGKLKCDRHSASRISESHSRNLQFWNSQKNNIFDVATLTVHLEPESASTPNTFQVKRLDVRFGFHYWDLPQYIRW